MQRAFTRSTDVLNGHRPTSRTRSINVDDLPSDLSTTPWHHSPYRAQPPYGHPGDTPTTPEPILANRTCTRRQENHRASMIHRVYRCQHRCIGSGHGTHRRAQRPKTRATGTWTRDTNTGATAHTHLGQLATELATEIAQSFHLVIVYLYYKGCSHSILTV